MNVGERLRNLRLNMKKTLKEESEIFNVSLNSVYRWEHDLSVPRKSVLKKIADYYDVPYKWLVHGGDVEGDTDCDVCILNPERNTEQKILKMLRKLSPNNKYKVLGYIERMCVEDNGDE
jgi:transcriptional regulator with XRE-family HTH domain